MGSLASVSRARLIAVQGSARLGRSRFHLAEVELERWVQSCCALHGRRDSFKFLDSDAYVQCDRDCLVCTHDRLLGRSTSALNELTPDI